MPDGLEVSPDELSFILSPKEATPKALLTLKYSPDGSHGETIAFKVGSMAAAFLFVSFLLYHEQKPLRANFRCREENDNFAHTVRRPKKRFFVSIGKNNTASTLPGAS